MSDNGPQFNREEFSQFLRSSDFDIWHVSTAPYHPATHGLAERFAQTSKSAMQTSNVNLSTHARLQNFLLTFHNTPHAMRKASPAQLLLLRSLRTRLDLIRTSIPSVVQQQQRAQAGNTLCQPARDLPLEATAMVRNYGPVVDHFSNAVFQQLSVGKFFKPTRIGNLVPPESISFKNSNPTNSSNFSLMKNINYLRKKQTIFLLIVRATFSDIDECEETTTCPEKTNCLNSAGTYYCPCRRGFKKKSNQTCENINECTLHSDSCDENAICNDTIGSFSCVCKVGFRKDGDRCININECNRKASPCHDNATCTDIPGSFQCRCLVGFSGNGEECTPIDWCAEGVHSCNSKATCYSLTTLSLCTCVEGFTGNGSSCENVDECTAGTHTCATEALCYDSSGSYSCVCVGGFSGSGSNCSNVNECASGTNVCHQNSICEDSIGSFNCTCMSGYIGNGTYCSKEIIRKRTYLLSRYVTRKNLGRINCSPRNFGKTTPKKSLAVVS